MSGILVYREDTRVIRAFGGIQAMKQFPVVEWLFQKRGDWEGHVPASWRIPQDVLRQYHLVPIGKAEALRRRQAEQRSGTLKTQAYRRKVDALARKLGLFPGSGVAQALLDGRIDEAEAFQKAERIRRRHEDTRYDELLARGFSQEEARDLISEGGDR